MKIEKLSFALFLPLALASAAPRVNGVPNFQIVNEHVLRGGQPTSEGFRNLAANGVKTVVDLREADQRAEAEKEIVESLGMKYVNIPMQGMTTPTDQQISKALKLMKNDSAGPVFVHCQRGADRTGAVVACYRIEHDNWNNVKALHEARGFGMRWYQLQLQSYVLAYHSAGTPNVVAEMVDSIAR
jgi:tyrosine-protein phosphatase SIW14